MHESVRLECPVEFINITPMNPLISKCQIKVCYVSDEPNRNGSIITKEVAREMANSLPGSPIVGKYNSETEDFEEHNSTFEIEDGEIKFKDDTRPYGFVDLNAKCWFAKYLDDNEVEREYLVTEGYLWTGQYPEAQRAIDKGNNQSMELDEETLKAHWAEDYIKKSKFFIINEAIISKLCILGEDYEPCFEGASITAPQIQFSLGNDFKNRIFSMIAEITEYLNKEGQKVPTKYAVEIGGSLWDAIWNYLETKYPDTEADYPCSLYRIEGVFEESGQKFIIVQGKDQKYFRIDFSIDEANGFVPADNLVEVTKTYVPSEQPQFAFEDVEKYASQKKSAENEDKTEQEPVIENEENTEEQETSVEEPVVEEMKFSYNSLEEIPEYVELLNKYNALVGENETLTQQNGELLEFRHSIEKQNKEKMISSFYMLSDEDKHDVIENIDKYSIDEIEAKLSILCVRNKVNFNLNEEEKDKGHTTYSFEDMPDDAVPAWVKSVRATAKSMN